MPSRGYIGSRYSREYIKRHVDKIRDANSLPATPKIDLYDSDECFVIGGLEYKSVPLKVIECYGETLLAAQPSTELSPGTITAKLFSYDGRELLRVIENEIVFNIEHWDIEAVGRSVKIRSAPGRIVLHIHINAPNGLIVEALDMSFRNTHLFANRFAFCIGRRIADDRYLWFSSEVRIVENRFKGVALRVDNPSVLAEEWNRAGKGHTHRPILRQHDGRNLLEFNTIGTPGANDPSFSTAFLSNSHMAMDSYSGLLHYASGIAIANRVGSFLVGPSFYKIAPIGFVRELFSGQGPTSVDFLAQNFFK